MVVLCRCRRTVLDCEVELGEVGGGFRYERKRKREGGKEVGLEKSICHVHTRRV